MLEFAYNDKQQASTGYSPFYLNNGRHPRTPAALLNEGGMSKARPADTRAFVSELSKDLVLAKQNLERARQTQAKWANAKRRHHEFRVGDEVMLATENLNVQDPGPARKLRDRWVGPFVVERMINPVAARLGRGGGCSLPDSYKFHPVVHVHWIKPYRDGSEQFPYRTAHNSATHPLWFERDNAGNTVEVHAVDRLLDRRVEAGKTSHYVKWIGFDDERYHTWEPVDSLMRGGAEVQRMVRDWEESTRRVAELSAQPTPLAEVPKRKRGSRGRKTSTAAGTIGTTTPATVHTTPPVALATAAPPSSSTAATSGESPAAPPQFKMRLRSRQQQ